MQMAVILLRSLKHTMKKDFNKASFGQKVHYALQ